MSPFKEIAVGNTPPVIRFEPNGKARAGSAREPRDRAGADRVASATPLALTVWVDRRHEVHERHERAARRGRGRRCTLRWSKYRGPGAVTFDKPRPERGEAADAGERRRSTARRRRPSKFGEAGDYVLHVIANDYSGDGGGGFGCCWTTALLKVAVK